MLRENCLLHLAHTKWVVTIQKLVVEVSSEQIYGNYGEVSEPLPPPPILHTAKNIWPTLQQLELTSSQFTDYSKSIEKLHHWNYTET